MEPTDDQRNILDALMDRIIPKDDFPSATENGVGVFLWQLLRTDLKNRAEEVRLGLNSLNEEAIAWNGRPFLEQSSDEQDQILRILATGQTKAIWMSAPQHFFELIVRLTNEGYYADPGNGANVEQASWRMIGYQPRLPAKPAPEHWLEKNG